MFRLQKPNHGLPTSSPLPISAAILAHWLLQASSSVAQVWLNTVLIGYTNTRVYADDRRNILSCLSRYKRQRLLKPEHWRFLNGSLELYAGNTLPEMKRYPFMWRLVNPAVEKWEETIESDSRGIISRNISCVIGIKTFPINLRTGVPSSSNHCLSYQHSLQHHLDRP